MIDTMIFLGLVIVFGLFGAWMLMDAIAEIER